MGASRRKPEPAASPRRRRPARTIEEREGELNALAYDLVERRLRDGTATSQETTYLLKVGSSRDRLERDKLLAENELLRARVADLSSRSDQDSLAQEAIKAFKGYSGEIVEEEYYD